MTLADDRRAFERLYAACPPPASLAVRPAREAGVPGVWLEPEERDAGSVVLYLHGGSYALGSSASHRGLAGRVAAAARARALLADYRRAPEHPYPAALDDCLAVYRSLRARNPGPVALAGDSAGGGLALACTLAARERGLPLPAALVLMSPWADLALEGKSVRDRAHRDRVLTPGRLALRAAQYAANRDRAEPLLSPLRGDLTGLLPLLIQAGTEDILYDDATRLAAAAGRAGTPAVLQPYDGMPHVFQKDPAIPECGTAIDQAGRFLRDCLANALGEDRQRPAMASCPDRARHECHPRTF